MGTALILIIFFSIGFMCGRIKITGKQEFVDDRKDYQKTCKYCKKKFITCYDTIDECSQCSDQGWID